MKKNNIFGYIEGYYGKILTWSERKDIIDKLKINKMNTYFYAPKSDLFHRQNWKKKYPSNWCGYFSEFCEYAKLKGISVIMGISPGLTFDFDDFDKFRGNTDFFFLKSKIKQFLKCGANKIALLMDDIPNNFYNDHNQKEGSLHASLINLLSIHLDCEIYFVPRIYADELKIDSKFYLSELSKNINPNVGVFYSGKNIVSKAIWKDKEKIYKQFFSNKIIIWDNLYANDYCPRRFFVGPWINRCSIDNIMINGTGMIKTDLLILDIVAKCKNKILKKSDMILIFKNNKIPPQFFKIMKYFSLPNFGNKPGLDKIKFSDEDIQAIDFLLWEWTGELAREWYLFLMGLKHDLLILQKKLTVERIIKTQTTPLTSYILKNK